MQSGHVAAIVVLAMLTPAAWGQRRNLVGETSREAEARSVRVSIATTGPISVQTTVSVPDGGTTLAAGFSQASESRREAGAPLLGKLPLLGRPLRNVGYGRSVTARRVGVTVRVIDRRDEEYRQTGFRSP